MNKFDDEATPNDLDPVIERAWKEFLDTQPDNEDLVYVIRVNQFGLRAITWELLKMRKPSREQLEAVSKWVDQAKVLLREFNEAPPQASLVDSHAQQTQEEIQKLLATKQRKLQELSVKREAKEISPFDFDLNFIHRLYESGLPLTRKDMQHESGEQALVLTREDFEIIGCLDFIHASGERMLIEPESLDPNDVFVLYPNEVVDEETYKKLMNE